MYRKIALGDDKHETSVTSNSIRVSKDVLHVMQIQYQRIPSPHIYVRDIQRPHVCINIQRVHICVILCILAWRWEVTPQALDTSNGYILAQESTVVEWGEVSWPWDSPRVRRERTITLCNGGSSIFRAAVIQFMTKCLWLSSPNTKFTWGLKLLSRVWRKVYSADIHSDFRSFSLFLRYSENGIFWYTQGLIMFYIHLSWEDTELC